MLRLEFLFNGLVLGFFLAVILCIEKEERTTAVKFAKNFFVFSLLILFLATMLYLLFGVEALIWT